MLIACTSCHRQYDVGDLEPGTKVRCACTRLNVVPRPRAKRVPVSHCENCGGARAATGPCAYCDAPPAPARPRGGFACPECFAQLAAEARFCHGCGTAIAPEAVVRAVTRSTCPRCQGGLLLAEGRGDPFHQCGECGGIWLGRKEFQRFVDRAAGQAVPPELQRSTSRLVRTRTGPGRRRSRVRRRARKAILCPTCGGLMLVTHYADYSGIEVDACVRHGWWFDGDELARIGTFVASGGLAEAARRRAVRRRARHRVLAYRRRIAAERSGRNDLLLGLLFGLADRD